MAIDSGNRYVNMSVSVNTQDVSNSAAFKAMNAEHLVEKTWEMAKAMVFWDLCLIICLSVIGGSFNIWNVTVFFQGILVGWILYQQRWYVVARYYIFTGVCLGSLMILLRFGPESYVYFIFVPIILAILSSFETKVERFGISFLLLATAYALVHFEVAISFIEPVQSPEKYQLLFVLLWMGLCYTLTARFLEQNRDFRLRLREMVNLLEAKEAKLQLNCRHEEIQVRQLEVTNQKLAAEIENRIKVERQFSSSNEKLAQFSYAASHDLKEPLRSISGFIQLIQRKVVDANDDELAEHSNAIIDNSSRMTKLLDDLLEYSKASKSRGTSEVVNLDQVARSVCNSLRNSIAASNADVVVSTLPSVMASRNCVGILFEKLISNAIQYRSEDRNPYISISSGKEVNGMVEILITDNGKGIDKDMRHHVFKLFNRGANHAGVHGSGVGLSTCRKIIRSHRGDIRFVSTATGDGVTCIFTMPKVCPVVN